MATSANYAQECYRNSTYFQDCPTFVRKKLPWTSRDDIGCPFLGRDKICRSNSTNLRLESYIDSNFDLGINSPSGDRFSYRSVLECAPLKTEGYSEHAIEYTRQNTSSRDVQKYYYGTLGPRPMTYQYNSGPATELLYLHGSSFTMNSEYTIRAVIAYASPNGSYEGLFIPIPDVQSPMADVSLVFLSANDIMFSEPTDDSCCTPLAGSDAVAELVENLWTKEQKTFISWFKTAIHHNHPSLNSIIENLGRSSLTSRYKLQGGRQGPLPTNQWQLEVQYWFSTMLANLQMLMIDTATGPADANLTPWLRRPQNREEHRACRSQKIRSDSFTSFSTLGLAILLGVGGLIIAVSLSLEFLVDWIQRRRKIGTYRRLEWQSNAVLQLQRLAHEELGFGTWSRTADDHPITAPGEHLASLDISDPNHPKLAARAAKSEATSQEGSSGNSTGETIGQGAPKPGMNHMVTVVNSSSVTTDSGSPTIDGQASQAPTQSVVNEPLRHHHHPTW
ncbi:MAG: hypothetical protein M1816_007506 [Peltula sp. TS41687]|nr:MAG: hypothetical protein M1816_007506 [Peltula sp. TS41687]